jgi:hypothetical protein
MPKALTVEKVAFGVQYEPQYSVSDRKGAVIDQVLRAGGTPFGPDTFPYSRRSADYHHLVNDTTSDSLRLSERDVILAMSIAEDQQERIRVLGTDFDKYVLGPLRDAAKLRNITRYGVLLTLAEASAWLSESPVQHFLARDVDNARSMNLRFTKRLPTHEAIAKRRVKDFRNVIYTINQSDEGEVKISVDYQEYFDPALDKREWEERAFDTFAEQGLNYFSNEFEPWIGRLIRDEAA